MLAEWDQSWYNWRSWKLHMT